VADHVAFMTLELNCGMADRVVIRQVMRDVAQEPVAVRHGAHDQVRRQGCVAGAHGPDMKIMQGDHTRQPLQVRPRRAGIDITRDGIHCQVHGVPQQTPGRHQYDGSDHQADDRIDPVHAVQQDQGTRGDHP